MSNENSAKSLRDLREDGIVYVAAELFLQNGIESVKMTDVAEKGGGGRGLALPLLRHEG